MATLPVIRVIGSLNIDFVTNTPAVPGPGETLTATSLTIYAGGKGANQAAACGRAAFISEHEQDVTVDMIGAVGENDPYYKALLKPALEQSGVTTSGIQEMPGTQTGTATIIVDEGSNGENRILFVPGANYQVQNAQASLDTTAQGSLPNVVVLQGELLRSTTLQLLDICNSPENQTCVVFNPAPVFPEGVPLDALKNLAVLVVNETECLLLYETLATLHTATMLQHGDLMSEAQLERIAERFHDLAHVTILIVTLGSRGAFYSSRASRSFCRGVIPASKVDSVLDTTAAGDTFVGYLSTALARHIHATESLSDFDIRNVVIRANQAAAKCVQRRGAIETIPFGYE